MTVSCPQCGEQPIKKASLKRKAEMSPDEIRAQVKIKPVTRNNIEMFEVWWGDKKLGEGYTEQGARTNAANNVRKWYSPKPMPLPKVEKKPKKPALPPGVVDA